MKDLLGDPLPPTPAMNAPLPWRVFRMNDCEWWLARSADDARADYFTVTGIREDNVTELSDAELAQLNFRGDGPPRTFADELARRVTTGIRTPEPFASTEY